MGFSTYHYLKEAKWQTDDLGDTVVKTLKNRDGQELEVTFDVLGFVTTKLKDGKKAEVINQETWNGNDSSINRHLKKSLDIANKKAKSVFA